jgi:hypothetical protein
VIVETPAPPKTAAPAVKGQSWGDHQGGKIFRCKSGLRLRFQDAKTAPVKRRPGPVRPDIPVKGKPLPLDAGNKNGLSILFGPAKKGPGIYFVVHGKEGKDNGMIPPQGVGTQTGGGSFPLPAKGRGVKQAEFLLYGKPEFDFGKGRRFFT